MSDVKRFAMFGQHLQQRDGQFVYAYDYDTLKAECKVLQMFIDQAFQAHPNLDLDIEALNART